MHGNALIRPMGSTCITMDVLCVGRGPGSHRAASGSSGPLIGAQRVGVTGAVQKLFTIKALHAAVG